MAARTDAGETLFTAMVEPSSGKSNKGVAGRQHVARLVRKHGRTGFAAFSEFGTIRLDADGTSTESGQTLRVQPDGKWSRTGCSSRSSTFAVAAAGTSPRSRSPRSRHALLARGRTLRPASQGDTLAAMGQLSALPRVALLALLLLGLGACHPSVPPIWSGEIQSWGSMRDVMRSGATEGRVALADAVQSEHTIGLGALEGLTGEIAIVDGEAWVARVEDGAARASRGARTGDRATLLAVTEVSDWEEHTLERDLAPGEIAPWLGELGRRVGLTAEKPWPFVVEGQLVSLETHVLNGQCPFAGEVDAAHTPVRRSFSDVAGTLVGFYAPSTAGTLVHHGQALHVHAILERTELWVGHVDEVGLRAGARVRIPRG